MTEELKSSESAATARHESEAALKPASASKTSSSLQTKGSEQIQHVETIQFPLQDAYDHIMPNTDHSKNLNSVQVGKSTNVFAAHKKPTDFGFRRPMGGLYKMNLNNAVTRRDDNEKLESTAPVPTHKHPDKDVFKAPKNQAPSKDLGTLTKTSRKDTARDFSNLWSIPPSPPPSSAPNDFPLLSPCRSSPTITELSSRSSHKPTGLSSHHEKDASLKISRTSLLTMCELKFCS